MRHAIPALATAAALTLLPAAAGAQAGKTKVQDAAVAIFAGGCFWCVESDFDKVPGVMVTTSGYIGGKTTNPTYKQVSAGGTGHAEAVKIVYDPSKVTYERLLKIFLRTTDPLTAGGQFCDRGDQYRNAIFAIDRRQRKAAEEAIADLKASGLLKGKIVTTVENAGPFYPAEGYHQNYYKKNPLKYKYYRWNCGRDQRVKAVWGKEAYGF
ncbi:MAG: peptide-methionine (S)-S-oxide reductase MsrA [Beijerinckiaceae bacterium]